MSTIPPIKDVMTTNLLTVDLVDSVRKAQELFSQHRFRHLPVLDKGKPVSILSDRDINLALVANADLGGADALYVEDVCTLHTDTVTPNTPLDEVVVIMAEKHIGSMLVVENDELMGIFTATDACSYLGKCLRGEIG